MKLKEIITEEVLNEEKDSSIKVVSCTAKKCKYISKDNYKRCTKTSGISLKLDNTGKGICESFELKGDK